MKKDRFRFGILRKYVLLTCMMSLYWLTGISQPFSNVIHLNGLDDFVTVPNNSNLNQTSTITIEAWIKPCIVTGFNTILSKNWCNGGQIAYYLAVVDGKLKWRWDNNGCTGTNPSYESNLPLIQPNQWQHIAVTHTPTGVSLYLNGSLIAGTLFNGSFSTIQVSTEPLRIGVYRGLSGAFGGFFNGTMDEVRIWNYNVSAADVQARYNSPLIGNETGLVAYYDMNTIGAGGGLAIPNVAALTGNALNGTAVGTASTPVIGVENLQFCAPLGDESCNDILSSRKICSGDAVYACDPFGGHAFTVNWHLPGGTPSQWSGTGVPGYIHYNTPGIYLVMAFGLDGSGQLISTPFMDTIIVKPIPTPNLGNDTTLCPGDSLLLDVSLSGSSYLWGHDNSSSSRAVITTAGEYSVTVTQDSCEGTDHINVYYLDNTLLEDTIKICQDSSITLGRNLPGCSYLWTHDGSTNPMVTINEPGTYKVIISNGKCTIEEIIVVVFEDQPEIIFPEVITLCEGQCISLEAVQNDNRCYQYRWSKLSDPEYIITIGKDGKEIITEVGEREIIPLSYTSSSICLHTTHSTEYTVEVINTCTGCSAMQTVKVTVLSEENPRCGGIGTTRNSCCNTSEGSIKRMEVETLKSSLLTYPNPASQELTIQWSLIDIEDAYLKITDLAGRQIIRERIVVNSTIEKLNISDLPKGLYMITLERNDKIVNQVKFVKE